MSAKVRDFPPAGAAVPLPAPRLTGELSVEAALKERRSRRRYAADPLTLAEVSQLLWAAQGTTDEIGNRTAPSAGGLFPLEVYLVAGEVAELSPGIYSYRPASHDLEAFATGDRRDDLATAAFGQSFGGLAPVAIVIAAVERRVALQYGQRAPRYVHMEVGAAAENVHLQAEALGLATVMIGAFNEAAVKAMLALPREEEPLLIMPVGRR